MFRGLYSHWETVHVPICLSEQLFSAKTVQTEKTSSRQIRIQNPFLFIIAVHRLSICAEVIIIQQRNTFGVIIVDQQYCIRQVRYKDLTDGTVSQGYPDYSTTAVMA
jgi:hypothetical protein